MAQTDSQIKPRSRSDQKETSSQQTTEPLVDFKDGFTLQDASIEHAQNYLEQINKEVLLISRKPEWMEPVELKAPPFNILAMLRWWKEDMLGRWQLIFFFLCALCTIYILIEFTVVSESDGYTVAVWVTLGMVLVAVFHFRSLLNLRSEINSTKEQYYNLRSQLKKLDSEIRQTYESAKKSMEIYKNQQKAEQDLHEQIEELGKFQKNLEQYFQNDIKRCKRYEDQFAVVREDVRKMLHNQEKQLFIELYEKFERQQKDTRGLTQEQFDKFVADLPMEIQQKLEIEHINWDNCDKNQYGRIGYMEITQLADRFISRRASVISPPK